MCLCKNITMTFNISLQGPSQLSFQVKNGHLFFFPNRTLYPNTLFQLNTYTLTHSYGCQLQQLTLKNLQ